MRATKLLLTVALTFVCCVVLVGEPTPARADGNKTATEAHIEGQGALRALSPDGKDLGNCPLTHTDVQIEVSGFVSRARVTQTFANPFPDRIEAIYTFPLPADAGVRDFQMRIGDRVIQGELKRKEEAKEEYEAARDRGETASLLEQERPNIFIQSVANIEPGKPVSVTLEYTSVLEYDAGTYRIVFPMTVGPRYIPGTPAGVSGKGFAADTDQVPDASRITPMPTLDGETRAGHDINVRVAIHAGATVGKVHSITHEIREKHSGTTATVDLSPLDRIPNKDFVLEYTVAPSSVSTSVLATRSGASTDGYFTLLFQPAVTANATDIRPRDVVFVLDTSGSMSGEPMDKSKQLMHRMLETLRPGDAFNILTFDDKVSTLSPTSLPATPEMLRKGNLFVDGMQGGGGTEMMNGIRAAMSAPVAAPRMRMVVFLTDGYVGNDQEILAEVANTVGEARLFSFGIGSSVNRYLLDGLASRGRGAVQYVLLNSKETDAVELFRKRLDSPMLTDISLDWGGLDVRDLSVDSVPDIFAGQPIYIHGRYTKAGTGTLRIRGRLGSKPFEQVVAVNLPASEPQNSALESVWARQRLSLLSARMDSVGETEELKTEATDLALAHRLMSKYTSFIAVERRMEAVPGGAPRSVAVPVELPDGVSAEGIFGEAASLSLARFQPGDPEVRVDAPPSARSVMVVFPFGETHEAVYEPRLDRWTTRFLVPRNTADGNYEILVLVTLADGTVTQQIVPYTVDSQAPAVTLTVDAVTAGGRVMLRAKQLRMDVMGRAKGGRGVRTQVLPDLGRVWVETPDGQVITLAPSANGEFVGAWSVPMTLATGMHSLRVVSADLSGNQTAAQVAVTVVAQGSVAQ